jgi:hypothetical protein
MSASLTSIEAIVIIGAGAAAVSYLAYSLIDGNTSHALVALVAYAAVWVYGLMRASYT